MEKFPRRKIKTADDLHDPEVLQDRFANQDPRLLKAAADLSMHIFALPPDPEYPNIQPRALLVGGFVRDSLLGLKPKDLDVEVYGVGAKRLMTILEQLYPGCVKDIGDTFPVLAVYLGDDIDFDVSIPRRDSKVGEGHNDFISVGDPSMSIEEAARRRDFSMNSMAADLLTMEIYDPYKGIPDLEKRLLRVTDPKQFQEDPLRVYRAVQFKARMNLKVEPQTFTLMKEMVDRGAMDHLTKDRLLKEMTKLLLKAEKPSVGFELMRELGIIEKYYPELHALIGVPQESEWHPEGDVWIHTMMVVDAAAKIIKTQEQKNTFTEEEKLQVMMGALCHDLGKPATTGMAEKDGVMRLRALGHEEAGKEPAAALLARWKAGKKLEEAVVAVTADHLKPNMWTRALEKGKMNETQYANAVRKLIKKLHPTSWKVLLAVSEADHRGRAVPGVDKGPYADGELFREAVAKFELDKEPTKPLVQGRDVLALGIKPGKKVGAFVNCIEEARDEGKIKTREEALEMLKELVRRAP